MALPGSEQITNEAQYAKPMSASDYAKAAMKNAKEQGADWLNTMQQGANASGVNSVGSAPAPTGGEMCIRDRRCAGQGVHRCTDLRRAYGSCSGQRW